MIFGFNPSTTAAVRYNEPPRQREKFEILTQLTAASEFFPCSLLNQQLDQGEALWFIVGVS